MLRVTVFLLDVWLWGNVISLSALVGKVSLSCAEAWKGLKVETVLDKVLGVTVDWLSVILGFCKLEAVGFFFFVRFAGVWKLLHFQYNCCC